MWPVPNAPYGAYEECHWCQHPAMDTKTATIVAVAVLCTGIAGATFARWRRALSDLRRTGSAVPELRRTAFSEFRRLLVFGGGVALLVYVWMRGH